MSMNWKYFFELAGLIDAVDEAIVEPKIKAAVSVQNYAKRSMKKGGGRARTPSPPGTPPNVQKSHLRPSILWAVEKDGKVIVGPTVAYGKIHEFGGSIKSGGKTRLYPERAYMRPALLKSVMRFPILFKNLGLDKTKAGKMMKNKGGI